MTNKVICGNCSLDNICIPRGLNAHEIDNISKVVKARKILQRGEFLYRQGDELKGILAIKAGSAKLVSNDFHGNEHILSVLLPGELLGFDGLSDNTHQCSAIALETCSFCLLPAESIDDMFLRIPGLARELFRHTGDKVNDDHQQRVLNKRPSEERLAFFLLNLSERLQQRGFSAASFRLSMTRQEIGNHLGLALETVSRLLKKFQQQNLIAIQNKSVTLLDIDGLKALLQPSDSEAD
ncbi:helix-turn-helix domain-containing protein [methane-oxidizing endosymbiont of Gigantopelta aegis]|uniref:helix-turn-helix domain-containing protein n=1 Tax=methane-oxidizing endosymbiont of Gigantopelta aegis TaxID=2794938 RepID=UPI0018DAFDC8|nr:helix-turn-helix domain-containing protein [methane-oxidizing endosymbiont of Gigantopelta aegis]